MHGGGNAKLGGKKVRPKGYKGDKRTSYKGTAKRGMAPYKDATHEDNNDSLGSERDKYGNPKGSS